ncbi:hypothetical protein [Streptomyces cylindrosporus]|uniref:Uncharacterized protein n=1 Tax=Streptomyces cylindrosporus TaxID=2927583 RepID=A0ABS9YK12_9ACTN|nr:hypothetical protein [Streptomyces cylindrosporus]MCI3277595.1 hypothetical protein [Streptomyces cylindrosporus]
MSGAALDQDLEEARRRVSESTRRAIQTVLRRLVRKASQSPSRICIGDSATKEQ